MFRLALVALMSLTLVILSAAAVFAAAPTIEKVKYDGKGKVEVDFVQDVSYKKVKVTVKEPSGKTYKAKILEKDDDDLDFKLKHYKAGKKYKFTISGIKIQGSNKYGKVKGSVKVPAKAKITKSKAISIAVKHAKEKLHATSITDKKAEKDTYKGKATWEVEFDAMINGNPYEFEYNVSRSTGKILHYKYELDD
jgi:hypothetical protein